MGENTYRRTTLENGIRVITEKMVGVRSISMGVLTEASPRAESPEESGLAHLVEHAMFQGTSNRDVMEISRLMDTAGGQMGAFTTRDYTFYAATVLDDYSTYALDLLGDILLNSTFPHQNLEREKGAILREIDARRDMPYDRVNALLKAFAWPDHPLGRPIAGRPETVTGLTRDDVIYFAHQYYLPDGMIVAAAGNVEHADFVAQVRDAFWRMLGEGQGLNGGLTEYRTGVTVEQMEVSQTYFCVGIRAVPYAHRHRYGLHVLNNLLGGGSSSRLFRRMREERGLVHLISSDYHAYSDDGVLVIQGSTAPEYLMRVLTLILVELEKLVTTDRPVDEEELWKAKMQIRGQHLIAAENTHTRMSRLTTQEFYFGRHIAAEEILAEIDAVDSQTIQQLAKEALIKPHHNLAIAVVGPEDPEHYEVAAIEDLLTRFQRSLQEGGEKIWR